MIADEDEVAALQTHEAFYECVAGPWCYIIALPVELLFANEAVENFFVRLFHPLQFIIVKIVKIGPNMRIFDNFLEIVIMKRIELFSYFQLSRRV